MPEDLHFEPAINRPDLLSSGINELLKNSRLKADLVCAARGSLNETGMEYGGITPVGLPENYPILIDSRIAAMEKLIVGGGYRRSKLLISGKALAELPNAVIVEGLGKEI